MTNYSRKNNTGWIQKAKGRYKPKPLQNDNNNDNDNYDYWFFVWKSLGPYVLILLQEPPTVFNHRAIKA